MDMAICFGSQFLSGEDVDAQEVFKHISFDVWACGDCGELQCSALIRVDHVQ